MIRFFAFLFSLLSIGVVIGLGAVAGVVAWYGRDLPSYEALENYHPPMITRVYARDGRPIAEYLKERRVFVPIDEMPDLIKHAVIAAEDQRFYEHPGFDLLGIASAVKDAAMGKRLRGASTLTQQVMKNFLLSSDREFERKIKEIILAYRIERVMSKDQILELYLNEFELGAWSFGFPAAAQNYFGKNIDELEIGEAAYLAALLKGPSQLHPVRHYERAVDRRNYVIGRLAALGYISEAEAQEAAAKPLKTVLDGELESTLPEIPPADHFTAEVRRQLADTLGTEILSRVAPGGVMTLDARDEIAAELELEDGPRLRELTPLGEIEPELRARLIQALGERQAATGGLSVRSTIDERYQSIAEKALQDRLVQWDIERKGWRGPFATIPEDRLGSEDDWRAALAENRDIPRDIEGWHPAVVLKLGASSARVGIEGVEEDADGHYVSVSDFKWARPEDEDGALGPRPDQPSDILAVGDVVFVTAALDKNGDFERWSLRQLPDLSGAFVAMDARTGRVLAMVGGFSYETSNFNRATQAERQPGSSFKPLVYATALDNGYTPSTVILDAPIVIDTGSDELWRPKNASNKFYGPSPMRLGIEQSRNVMTVRLAQEIGMDQVAKKAELFGVYDDMPEHLSYALGAGETTLYKMVSAYSVFANGGLSVTPTLVDRVQDRRGNTIWRHGAYVCEGCEAFPEGDPRAAQEPWLKPNAHQVMDPVTAYQLTLMMQGVTSRGTARQLSSLGIPLAGKTGTTNEARDVWFIGFTPDIVAGCFIGYDNPKPIGRGAAGGTLCAPVFQQFMEQVMQDRPVKDFQVPPTAVAVKVDRFSGRRLADDAEGDHVVVEAFHPEDVPAVGAFTGTIIGGDEYGAPRIGGDLPMDGSDLPMTSTGAVPPPAQGGTAAAGGGQAAPRPAPPAPPSGGFSAGGLY